MKLVYMKQTLDLIYADSESDEIHSVMDLVDEGDYRSINGVAYTIIEIKNDTNT